MKILFLVPWIEVEYGWGDRPEGYQVFDSVEECINSTKKASIDGNYESGSGYCGPERPLHYLIINDISNVIEGPFPKFIQKTEYQGNRVEIN